MEYFIRTIHKDPKKYENQIKELIQVVFPVTEKNREEEIEEFYTLEKERFGRIIALTQMGKVIGKISMYKRNIFYIGKTIVLGGIGGVCTDPLYRKKGIAKSLLPHAVKALLAEKCDIAYLCTDMNSLWKVNMYKSVGFKPLPYGYIFVGKSGKKYSRQDGMLAPISSPKVLEKIFGSGEPFFIGNGRW